MDLRLPLIGLALSVAVVGCPGGTTPNPNPTPGSSPTTVPNSATVQIVNSTATGFSPSTVTIKKGGTVTFVNADSMAHTASPTQGAQFTDSGNIPAGAQATVTFSTAGEQNYLCAYHPIMRGKVVVVD